MMLWLVACEQAPLPAPPSASVWLSERQAASGAEVELHAPEGSTVAGSTNLVVEPSAADTWKLTGADGSYIVTVSEPGGGTPSRLFFDIGVKGPTGGPMDDLQAPPPPPPPIWPWVVAGGILAAATAAGAVWAIRRYTPPPPPPRQLPPHEVARRAWNLLRERTDLDAPAIASEMSVIFRTWIDAAWGLPATQRTRREILDSLAGMLTAAELESARRLLSATDLVKFAERSQHANLFEQLDQDFQSLVKPVRRV